MMAIFSKSGPSNAPDNKSRRFVLSAAKRVVFLLVLFFVGRELLNRFGTIQWSDLEFRPIYATLALAAALLGKAFNVLTNRSLLSTLRQPPPWRQMMVVSWLPPIGKYMPGKVASVVGAVWFLRKYNVPTSVAASIIFMLNGLMVTMGLTLAVPLTLSEPILPNYPWIWICSLGLLAVGLICLHPRVFFAVANFILVKLGREKIDKLPRVRDYTETLAFMLCQYILHGLSLWLMVLAVTDISETWIAYCIFTAALASTVGFIAIFAPAGLGVRDGILLVALTPVLATGGAIVVVAMRLVQTIVDVLLALAALVIMLSLRKRETVFDHK